MLLSWLLEASDEDMGLFTTQGAGTRADKMVSMENVNLPIGQNTTAAEAASRSKNEPTKIRRVELVYCIGLLVCGVNYKLKLD